MTREAMIMIDAEGHVLFWDNAAENLFGWDAKAMMGQTLERIMPAHHWRAHQAALARLREGYAPRLMGRVLQLSAIHRSGEEFPIELALQRQTDLKRPEPGDWRYVGIIRQVMP
jgi:PAS domain S-box-containing protein